MNPLTWDAPRIAIYIALFCIVFCRAGATHLLGRGIFAGLSHLGHGSLFTHSHYRRACDLVERYGSIAVIGCFFTVGFQTVILIASGALHMSWRRFLPALLIGSIAWAGIYGTVGYVGFEIFIRLYRFSPMGTSIGCITLVCLLLIFISIRRKKTLSSEMVEDPLLPNHEKDQSSITNSYEGL